MFLHYVLTVYLLRDTTYAHLLLSPFLPSACFSRMTETDSSTVWLSWGNAGLKVPSNQQKGSAMY